LKFPWAESVLKLKSISTISHEKKGEQIRAEPKIKRDRKSGNNFHLPSWL